LLEGASERRRHALRTSRARICRGEVAEIRSDLYLLSGGSPARGSRGRVAAASTAT
jgi:hypothetical protein